MAVLHTLGEITLINDDALTTQAIAPESVDLVVTSPPYNVDIHYGMHQDNMEYQAYLDFNHAWLKRAYEWLKPDGRLCLNVPLDKNKGGQHSVGADMTVLAKQVGFHYHATIIWNEGNISRRTAWGSWRSASAPYVIAPVELIIVLYKHFWRKRRRGHSDITREEFLEWTSGIWSFSGESKRRVGHPAPFPVELPRRCIKLFSFVGDVVLDPFVGSGSTLIAAALCNRKALGIEIDPHYCDLAMKRMMREVPVALPLANGLLSPNDKLLDNNL